MEEYTQYLLLSFERWNDAERCSNRNHRQKLRLLDDLNDMVGEFLDKKLRKYRRLDELNQLFGQAIDDIDTTTSNTTSVVTFTV